MGRQDRCARQSAEQARRKQGKGREILIETRGGSRLPWQLAAARRYTKPLTFILSPYEGGEGEGEKPGNFRNRYERILSRRCALLRRDRHRIGRPRHRKDRSNHRAQRQAEREGRRL